MIVAGCQSTEPAAKISAAFDAGEAAYIHKQGETRIDGHAFLKTPNGTAKHAVGEPVRLIPATAYARERFEKLYGGKKFLPAAQYRQAEATDPAYVEAQRTVKTDSNGRFSFDHVAPGTYYLSTQIVWKPEGTFATQGGAVWESVTVTGKEDKPIKAIVNGL
ncbi:MAG: carboxypeptidase regulatory-like domain-containing protein [Rhodoblastus sp.]|nr:MAG: carboxypeptidase regulatory-like domain-containing protein [Rhodoblastus sp.]